MISSLRLGTLAVLTASMLAPVGDAEAQVGHRREYGPSVYNRVYDLARSGARRHPSARTAAHQRFAGPSTTIERFGRPIPDWGRTPGVSIDFGPSPSTQLPGVVPDFRAQPYPTRYDVPLGAPQVAPPTPGFGIAPGGCAPSPPPSVVLADQVICQVDTFLRAFGPTRCYVPEGDCIYRDAEQLRCALVAFRQAAAAGAPACDLGPLYAAVDRSSCRLLRRVERIACGRAGPNVLRVRRIAGLCEQLRFTF